MGTSENARQNIDSHGKIEADASDSLFEEFEEKEPRLSKSIRTYIRRLKQKGEWDAAMRAAEDAREKKRRGMRIGAHEALNLAIKKTVEAKDLVTEAGDMIEAVWLLQANQEISPQDRQTEILAVLESSDPKVQGALEEKLPGIRDSVQPFLPRR